MLYAFDGTLNENERNDKDETNVLKFKEAYKGRTLYQAGVGVEVSLLERVAGALGGFGGKERVNKALEDLRAYRKQGNKEPIHVVGFSRGAALALDFVNEVRDTRKLGDVGFLGLWDAVASFGVPGNDVNHGYQLHLPKNVQACYHAMALDERRVGYELHRLATQVDDADAKGRLFEVWFPGVHSDVGGGNGRDFLRSLALCWMLRQAQRCGVPIKRPVFAAYQRKINLGKDNFRNADAFPVHKEHRAVRWNDEVHWSVMERWSKDKKLIANPPPKNAPLVDDDRVVVGKFRKEPKPAFAVPQPL